MGSRLEDVRMTARLSAAGVLTSAVEDVVAGALVLDGKVAVVCGNHLVVFVSVICGRATLCSQLCQFSVLPGFE